MTNSLSRLAEGSRRGRVDLPMRSAGWWILAGLLLLPAPGAGSQEELPSAPLRLAAEPRGSDAIEMSWESPADSGSSSVTGYLIEMSDSPNSGWVVLEADYWYSDDPEFPQYKHDGLQPGTTRFYRISATNASGTGPPSNIAGATTSGATGTRPGQPTDVVAVADGSVAIDVSWTPPTDTGNSAITGYAVEASFDGSFFFYISYATTTHYRHTDVGPNETRYFRVAAHNASGFGQVSKVVGATTGTGTKPGPPTDLVAMPDGSTAIDLSWNAPANTGGGILGYWIEMSLNEGKDWKTLQVNSTVTRYKHTGLRPGTTWHYRVSAVGGVGEGPPSDVAHTTTERLAGSPGPPVDVTATPDGGSAIDLAWTAPADTGSSPITGYQIDVLHDNDARWRDLVPNTGSIATAYKHTGLVPGTTRQYRVLAINGAGRGEASRVVLATIPGGVPSAPTGLVAVAGDHSRIDLSWEAPGTDGGTEITGYRIEVSEDSEATWTNLIANTGSVGTTHEHTDLPPGALRLYRVSAINETGTGPPSKVARGSTGAIAPDPPTNLVAIATRPTDIDLTWVAPAYSGGAPVTSYKVEVSEDGDAWTDLERSTGTDVTSYRHTGLQPGTTSYYRVSAINVAGAGLPSEVARVTTDDPAVRADRVNRAVLPYFSAAMTTSTLGAISRRVEAVASGISRSAQPEAASLPPLLDNMRFRGSGHAPTPARLLDDASFVLPFGGLVQDQEYPRSRMGIWGSTDYQDMGQPDGEEIQWDGDMHTAHIGADLLVRRGLMVGVAGSRSSGAYDFADVTYDERIDGSYQARMISANPYLAWLPGRAGLAVWGVGSLGWGEVAVEDAIEAERTSNVRMMTGALGGSGILLSKGGNALRVRSEGWLSRVRVAGSERMDSLALALWRFRASLEWSRVSRFGGGHEVGILVEGGMRHDGGDGMTGTGVELGGGLRYVSPGAGMTVEGHGRILAVGGGYEEWGLRGSLQIAPKGIGRGLSLRLAPTWGEAASGIRDLWNRGLADRPEMAPGRQRGRLNAEVEYGLPAYRGTPYGRIHVVDGGTSTLGTGVRYEITRVLDLRIEGSRTRSPTTPTWHELAVRARWRL